MFCDQAICIPSLTVDVDPLRYKNNYMSKCRILFTWNSYVRLCRPFVILETSFFSIQKLIQLQGSLEFGFMINTCFLCVNLSTTYVRSPVHMILHIYCFMCMNIFFGRIHVALLKTLGFFCFVFVTI